MRLCFMRRSAHFQLFPIQCTSHALRRSRQPNISFIYECKNYRRRSRIQKIHQQLSANDTRYTNNSLQIHCMPINCFFVRAHFTVTLSIVRYSLDKSFYLLANCFTMIFFCVNFSGVRRKLSSQHILRALSICRGFDCGRKSGLFPHRKVQCPSS